MPRFAAPISEEELAEKIRGAIENFSCEKRAWSKVLGFHTIDGLTFLGCMAGGDWENPVFFIIYWDGKKLRGYIPKKGNVWNPYNKKATGNEDGCYYDRKTGQYVQKETQASKYDEEHHDDDWDENALLGDILDRIKVKQT